MINLTLLAPAICAFLLSIGGWGWGLRLRAKTLRSRAEKSVKIEDACAALEAQLKVQTWVIAAIGFVLAAIGVAKLFNEG